MRSNRSIKGTLKAAVLAVTILLLGVGASQAQQQVNLTAGPTTLTMPDGSVVPMWGYSCGTVVSGSTATCAKSNPAAVGWSPVVITVPTGQGLQINLTNNLTFTPTGSTTPNTVPTSLVIVGQVGGGLGDVLQRTTTAAPDHSQAQAATTWPIAGGPGGTPPLQGRRVQSFSTEVAAGATTALTWATPSAGTYLLESGTHPSIQGPMGLYGMVVVTTAPTASTATSTTGITTTTETAPGTAYTGVPYDADIPLLLSEIDPVQNNAVSAAVSNAGFSETKVWSGQPGGCGNPGSGVGVYQTCYPPAVNYSPLYYLINGVAFNKTNASASLFPTFPNTVLPTGAGKVLVRFVNAGLHMHVPSIVGAQTGTATAPALPPGGFSLVAEDGNLLPGVARIQSEVFLAPGKTYDVMINAPAAGGTALPIFDRELSLSGNKTARDAGMLAYIGVNGNGLSSAIAGITAQANADTYNSVIPGQTLTVSDPGKGVIANDINVYGVKVVGTAPAGLTLNFDGTFTYTAGTATTFMYCGNGTTSGAACATVSLNAAPIEAGTGITCTSQTFPANTATHLVVNTPGVLAGCKDVLGYPLTVKPGSVTALSGGGSITVDQNGGFIANVSGTGSYTFSFIAQNSQGTPASSAGSVTLTFPTPSGLTVKLFDGSDKTTLIGDYRWVIEEDRTFYVDPTKTTNSGAAGSTSEFTFGTNFHTSYMPVVAQGCTGTLSCESGQTVLGVAAACDLGNGVCHTDAVQQTVVLPASVHLDAAKRYYISVLPGDAATPFNTANAQKGHGMGGAPIGFGQTAVTIYAQPTPLQPSKLSVFVFEDDYPLNGENDAGGGAVGGGIDGLAANEPGLGHFNITLFDDAGGTGDATGQMTYDMFNMPLSNSLSGTIDPSNGHNACPISQGALQTGPDSAAVASPTGITGTIVTCPRYEDDGVTFSPLAGQVVVANLMPGRYGVVATPGADLIAAGEEWLQTNTLDGQKAHDSFLRVGEPSYFQEFGPAGYHVSIGFANPKIINGRLAGVCAGTLISPVPPGTSCKNTVMGSVSTERMSRTPDERLYGSGDYSSFSFTQCYVSIGDPDGADFAFTKCDANGNFKLTGIPSGNWRVTVFDQWNDMLVDGLSSPVGLGANLAGTSTSPGVTVTASACPGPGTIKSGTTVTTCDLGEVATNQWQANIYTSTFFDDGTHVRGGNPGLSLLPTNIRFRDGSYSNFNNTDLNGNAGFNEVFPLFSWYVIESDTTRYKNTGTHVVYDAGGPADGSTACGKTGYPACGTAAGFVNMANTAEPAAIALPAVQRVPGARYCANADCPVGDAAGGSTGRIDPPWVKTEGWQGFSGQNSFLEFGKTPYQVGENGGIHGEVIYASTRPFDDPALLIHTSWTPDVPNVTINLYQEGTAPDGSVSLKLVDTTKTSSFDDWAQGFRPDGNPNMNCPGQYVAPTSTTPGDLFFFTLYNQPMYLDAYNNGGTPAHTIPANSQFKCYDGMHNWNQLQPAPYDGMYQFPSVTARDPQTGKPTGTNCTGCVPNTAVPATDYDYNAPMLPVGKYVVEMITPQGYELVKEEDKNILIGDDYIAPVTQEFGGLSNIFILPDQAQVASAYNAHNPQNPTSGLGRTTFPSKEGDTGSVETFWPCAGEMRTVPDFISLFPGSLEVAPFAGATRPLCDRKEVTLSDQESELAKFWVFTSTHVAAHFTGVITDDFTSEFDPFAPQFGEKFAPPNMPIAIKDWSGTEISRVYTDQWGAYNGLTYSTWEVNPPNPTGYAPTMMVTCMNDPGTGPAPDPLYNPQYSNFCYEIPFMPGQTQYMDTPVTPTSAFAGAGYNNPDCAYPDATPAIKEVDGDGVGPWVSNTGHNITITALGDQTVPNNAYSGPVATTAPYNMKTVTRHYGFGTATGSVTIGGASAVIQSWSDLVIVATVPSGSGNRANAVPFCATQQQSLYGGSNARCGQLVITAANGQQSIDSITVTVGGKSPTHVPATGSIQAAIDAAKPGDLIIVDPTCTATTGPVACAGPASTTVAHSNSTHQELVQMWKPVRLQGVGAASSIINANTHPAGKLDAWRRQIDCLFGLSIDATPIAHHTTIPPGGNSFDPSGTFTCSSALNFAVDRLPLEATVGWDATLNGNLAEQLQEPSLMGAYEGAGITVLGKGVKFPAGQDPFGSDVFPVGTLLLSRSDCGGDSGPNLYPGNFYCNPSSIDGLGITNSSQGGGGIFVHAWAHNLQIANNRIYNNSGTLAGGIAVGQGEFPGQYLKNPTTPNADPGSCQNNGDTNTQLPYCFDVNVNVHHNMVALNSSLGDELFSSTNSGAGGVAFCTGADYYQFNNNWVCGNLSTGDGGGLIHLGFIYNGDIEHNEILFNQSTNPTVPTNGGGIAVLGAPDTDPTCGVEPDQDCPPGTSDGIGPNLNINANLIMGNSADSGSGGGIRFHQVNGTEITFFPRSPGHWYSVNVTNNIITNNVAGWDGAGVSLQDAVAVNLINNTIVSNDTTASSGVLFNTLGAPLSSSPPPPNGTAVGAASLPQPAGLVAISHSPTFLTNLSGLGPLNCPTAPYPHPNCGSVSYPYMANDIFWQNRSFYIGVGTAIDPQHQQYIVSLFNQSGAPAVNQTATGMCPTASYWDLGVRGDASPSTRGAITLAPTYSVVTDVADYPGLNNSGSNPTVVTQYCNGSRIPPEFGGTGWQVPPGIADATVPNPPFTLTPAATVDEGNNWVNLSWGPLALTHPVTNAVLGNYALAAGSPAIDYIPLAGPTGSLVAPAKDFFGHARPATPGTPIDVGAVEFQGGGATAPPTLVSIVPNAGARGSTVPVTLSGTNLTGATTVNVSGALVTASNVVVVNATTVTATINVAVNAALGSRNVTITTPAGTSPVTAAVTFTVVSPTTPTLTSISPNTGGRSSVVAVTLTGTNLLTTTAVNVSGFGISVSGVNVVSDTTVTATFTISAFAPATARNVSVTTAGGTSNTVAFTVTGATVTAIAPTSGARGTTVAVSITGTGLTGATAVTMGGGGGGGGGGIACTVTGTPTATTVTASCVIARGAGLTTRNVRVTTPIGVTPIATAPPVTFTVTGAAATFTGPTPALTTGGASGTATRTGTVTVTNSQLTSPGPLTLTAAPAITKAGGAGGTFSIVAGGTCVSGVVLAPGASCTINVQYVPGGSTATATANVSVTGTGLPNPGTATSPNFTAN